MQRKDLPARTWLIMHEQESVKHNDYHCCYKIGPSLWLLHPEVLVCKAASQIWQQRFFTTNQQACMADAVLAVYSTTEPFTGPFLTTKC